jgi:hypothetical protein
VIYRGYYCVFSDTALPLYTSTAGLGADT